ncbi:protein translocase subunit SecDF, partial [Anaerostipes caccae]|nr:protein translocase subunit SecDF [Anaerostipes caccae]
LRSPKLYGKARALKELDFIGVSRRCMSAALLVIVVGLAFLPINKSKIGAPLNFDLEFYGGTSSTITFDKCVKVDDCLEKKVVSAYEKVSKSTSVQ